MAYNSKLDTITAQGQSSVFGNACSGPIGVGITGTFTGANIGILGQLAQPAVPVQFQVPVIGGDFSIGSDTIALTDSTQVMLTVDTSQFDGPCTLVCNALASGTLNIHWLQET